jgi:hypothetical protein
MNQKSRLIFSYRELHNELESIVLDEYHTEIIKFIVFG